MGKDSIVGGPRLGVDQAGVRKPVPRLGGPGGVRLVAGEPSEAGAQAEEACIGLGCVVDVVSALDSTQTSAPEVVAMLISRR